MKLPPDLISGLISFLSSLFGAIVGAFLAYKFAVRQFKIQKEVEIQHKQVETALSFYDELTSNDFSNARMEASKIFKEYHSANNLNDFYSDLPEEKRKHIRSVISYFRRLQLAVEYKQVNNQMVIDLLSGEFFSWYFKWLNDMVPEDWTTRQNIDKLNMWLQSVIPTAKYEQSKRKHIKERERQLSESHSNQQSNG